MWLQKTRVLMLCGALVFGGAAAAETNQVGVVALFKGDDSSLTEVITAHECVVKRKGAVVARQGPLELPDLDRFAVLSCSTSPLDQPGGALATFAEDPSSVLLEGDLTEFETSEKSTARQREYLLKLSYFSNSDPAARARDLKALAETVAPLPDRYQNETYLEVHRALGMRTPDEVATLFYDSPEAGNRFRNAHQAILEKVGAFNKAHLVSFVYLIARAD